MLKYSPGSFLGSSAETIAGLKKMVEELCPDDEPPCPDPDPSPCDPRGICATCDGAFTTRADTDASSLKLSACVSAVNWACCSESDPAVKKCYSFCPMVPEEGFDPATMTQAQHFMLMSWWNFRCASQVGDTAPTPPGPAADGARTQSSELTSLREQLEHLVQSSTPGSRAEGARRAVAMASVNLLSEMRKIHAARKVARLSVKGCSDRHGKPAAQYALSEGPV